MPGSLLIMLLIFTYDATNFTNYAQIMLVDINKANWY